MKIELVIGKKKFRMQYLLNFQSYSGLNELAMLKIL